MFFTWHGKNYGSIVGSYLPIEYGYKVERLNVYLSKSNVLKNELGRHVTLAYWIVDENFDINNLEMDSSKTSGPRYCYVPEEETTNFDTIEYSDGEVIHYFNTNLLKPGISTECKFYFNTDQLGIKANSIFVAVISTKNESSASDYDDFSIASLYLPTDTGTSYIRSGAINTNNIVRDNGGGLVFGENIIVKINNEDSYQSKTIPAKVACSDIRYRTWSEPKPEDNITYQSGFTRKYQISYLDGGEKSGEFLNYLKTMYGDETGDLENYNVLTINRLGRNENVIPYIINTNNKFHSDFGIPEGCLRDVIYDRPDLESYNLEVNNNKVYTEVPRWVFKRSRIKFTIEPSSDNKGIVNKKITLRYKVVTAIADNEVYSSKYKTKSYSLEDSTKPIELVICPRDEGVLDNMRFEVHISRRYSDERDIDSKYSAETIYKFNTFQKPIVNIAYPKMIRNESTGTGFKYAKILTSNMYSNFSGELAEANKYVCDALSVLLATPQRDASGIPMFVRFYLSEYQYGRRGTTDSKNWTMQDLFKSQYSEDYVTLNDLLSGRKDKMMADLLGIYNCDGAPILLSGRFNDATLKSIGKDYNLWTYNEWSSLNFKQTATDMNDDNKPYDVDVKYAWPVKTNMHDEAGNLIKVDGKPIEMYLNGTNGFKGDHMGAPIIERWSDGNPKSVKIESSKSLLFRAGYIYLLKVRMFHGAAAGAIGTLHRKYNDNRKNAIVFGKAGTGSYEKLTSGDYVGSYPINDEPEKGTIDPFNGWVGPADGTSGVSLNDTDRMKQTYAGFSEADYSIFEPVCPYTSRKNIVTVHPSSPQIGANQAISFNYRHLSKNVGAIESHVLLNDGTIQGGYFGKTCNGIQNTVTRIASMYMSCVESILVGFFKIKSPEKYYSSGNFQGHNPSCGESLSIASEKISLWIKPTNKRIQHANPIYEYKEAQSKKTNLGEYNHPLVLDDNILGKTQESTVTDLSYNVNSACYHFNQYRLHGYKPYKLPTEKTDTQEPFTSWPEYQIIYETYTGAKTGTSSQKLLLEEPMGNVYRWRPVINAMSSYNSEIQIESNKANVSEAKQYIQGENTLKNNNNSIPLDCMVIKYNESGNDYDLQTDYYFKDIHVPSKHNGFNFSNDASKQFVIKEFAGETAGGVEYTGSPVLYTMPSITSGTEYKPQISQKFFMISSQCETYGNLYSRVPTAQDCENGHVTSNNLNNIGNVHAKGAVTLNSNENNVIPITRTTHYLYFKTWINTVFTMKIDVSLNVTHSCEYEETDDGEVHVGHTTETTDVKTLYFDGTNIVQDTVAGYDENSHAFWQYPNTQIKFGNANGFSEVYGEDNHGWGRCLSADDETNRQINYDGTVAENKMPSGGIEVPLMVRYTPLLQPRLLGKKCTDQNTNTEKWLDIANNNLTIEYNKRTKKAVVKFVDGSSLSNNNYEQIKTNQIDLKVAYPYIKESNTYTTVMPNGGHGGNVAYDEYYIDKDSDLWKSTENTNLDFLGGFGICTAYNVLLVPSDPDLSTVLPAEQKYFANTDGHWNYFKQPANYFAKSDIFSIRSKSVSKAGPVLVAYNWQPNTAANNKNYQSDDNISVPSNFTNDSELVKAFKGRNYQTIPLNFTNLHNNLIYKDDNQTISLGDLNGELGFTLDEKYNVLQPGVTYDLVIIPVYNNLKTSEYDYNGNDCGTINGESPGGGTNETGRNIHLTGSNPLVLFNYFQVTNYTEDNSGGEGGGGYTPTSPQPNEPNVNKIWDSDSAIVFPNVDNVTYNVESGDVKECPGFWLNNSFRLILRLPSFRTKDTAYTYNDSLTVENMSGGQINNPDDFRFSDIQIHIGKLSELATEEYGYPNELDLKLNKLTSIEDLAKAHIISYVNQPHIFSKKLNDSDNDDLREILSAGSLNPQDIAYSHRFIEVNLSNAKIWNNDLGKMVPIYSLYPEGYYIQFRWKTAYSEANNEAKWSAWYGGSCDGGLHWWGLNGTDYYVPIRNYADIHTDFRNHIKESYPGSYITIPKNPIELSESGERLIDVLTGKGSIMPLGETDSDSLVNPKNAKTPSYYYNGNGNHFDSLIVPSKEVLTITETLNYDYYKTEFKKSISLSSNNDTAYINNIAYKKYHDTTMVYDESILQQHQHMWEMLYLDYIIRNMCKLYYKPNYNNTNFEFNSNLKYHLSVPYENNKPLILDMIDNPREWNCNKFYRRHISKQIFDDLNNQLVWLVNYIRNEHLAGLNTNKVCDNIFEVLPMTDLDFTRFQKSIIGNNILPQCGLTNHNNINHSMVSSNYIQNLWQNILTIIYSGSKTTKNVDEKIM